MTLDLAEVVDDLICTFEGAGNATMDTIAMFIFGWFLAALFTLWLGKFLYAKINEKFFINNKQPKIDVVSNTTTSPTSVVRSNSNISSGSKSVGGGYVPPTPPIRKRLTRASPGPELNRRPQKFTPTPQCTGPDNISVLWVNDIFLWLYNDNMIASELIDVWIKSLNEYMKKAAVDQGISVELIRILPETYPPNIGNVFVECDTKDDVTITCDCDATPAFQLKSTRQKDDKVETSHFRMNVNRFRARLNIFCVTEKLLMEIRCDGWPEIKVALAPVGNIKNSLDENHLQEVISDIFVNALRNSEVHLNLAQYPQCPRLLRHVELPVPTTGQYFHHNYDSSNRPFLSASSTPNHITQPDSPIIAGSANIVGKRLLVKVVRATQLGGAQGCIDPFCVIEMDEPPQKNRTSVQKNTDSPTWDEHFLLDVTNSTSEILFEIYDHGVNPHRFLGVGIVGVEELLVNPSQRQIISLQGRPYESDPISGTLTVEFMFIEGADIPISESNRPYKIKESLPNPLAASKNFAMTSTPIRQQNDISNNGLSPNESAIHRSQPLENNGTPLIIHSLQKHPSQRILKVELIDGVWKEVEENNGETTNEKSSTDHGQHDKCDNNESSNGKTEQQPTVETSGNNNTRSIIGGNNEEREMLPEFRGRSRRRRDFFGTIKRRLGKSKTRSKSSGPENNDAETRDDSLNRSISADRNRNNNGYHLNTNSRGLEESSRRSSMSEASGLSTASGRTYVNEASTLVLETIENGIKKHYLVPMSLAQKSKWRKKGTKLHIYNDHTFIAKHLTGGTVCQVCSKNIARRLGKQGYECRDCQMKCHKQCHVKVNDNCPTSSIHSIELSMLPVLSE